MLKNNEILTASITTLEEELEKARRNMLYYEMADGPQYFQPQETKDREANKRYAQQLFDEIKRRKNNDET